MQHPTRIVITGMGMVTPLGCGVDRVWQRLLGGASGVVRLPEEMCEGLDAKVGACVPSMQEDVQGGLDVEQVAGTKDLKKMDRFIVLALAAAQEALQQARWQPQTLLEQERTATVIASGIGGFPAIADAVRTTDQRGPRRLSPFTVPSFLVNLAAGHVSIRHGFKGPIGAPATACAASLQALGDGARLIRSGEADVAVCGGSDAAVHRVTQAGFAAARALSTGYADRPAQASRPFDVQRDGFVVGEGAGVLVIESLEHALQRGAVPLAELVGYGSSADAYHVTSGPADGSGAAQAMRAALRQAGIVPAQVQHVNAHATSTQVGDAAELAAFHAVFARAGAGTSASKGPAISATKSATGHLLGAAGAVEAIFTIMALHYQVAPPTLNLHTPDPSAQELDLVQLLPRTMAMDYALSNGFGFGGVNASAVFKRWMG
jgi:3-oxoacyl-[acyl-carrier-protein] synthase II